MSRRRNRRHPSIFRTFKRGNKYLRGHPDANKQWTVIDLSDESEIKFINPQLGTSFQCAICMETITDPVSIGCSGGHIFCKSCIHQTLRSNSRNRSHQPIHRCPSCRDPFTTHQIRDDNFAKRMIGDLKIKCPNHQITPKRNTLIQQQLPSNPQRPRNVSRASRERNENNSRSRSRSRSRERNENENKDEENNDRQALEVCDWSGEYRNLSQHLSICKFVIIPCETCSKPILRNGINLHKIVCPWSKLQCNKCDNYYFRCEAHLCPLEIVNCRYCVTPFKRNEMKIHWDTCNKKPIECEFYEFGCFHLIPRENMNEHLMSNQSNHLSMVRNKCDELNELETKYEELQENYDALDDKYETLGQEHEELQENYEELETKYEALEERHDVLEARIGTIERMQTVIFKRVFHSR